MKKIKLILITGLIMIVWSSATTFAQEELSVSLSKLQNTTNESEIRNILAEVPVTENGCFQALDIVEGRELDEFLQFLDEHFQNKSSTSSLANTAIARYGQYRNRLNSYLEVFSTDVARGGGERQATDSTEDESSVSNTSYSVYLQAYNECLILHEEYLSRAKDSLLKHVKNTATQKKTTILLEKQQAINDKLKDLNIDIARLYAYFQTLSNKLPAFTQDLFKSIF